MAQTLIACDFDGTVNRVDVGSSLVRRLMPDQWDFIKRSYDDGSLSNVDIYRRILGPFIKDNGVDIESLIPGLLVQTRGFGKFKSDCDRRGDRLLILSDGFDIYIRSFLEKYGFDIEYYANTMKRSRRGYRIEMPFMNKDCVSCGTCKAEVLKEKKRGYREMVYVGDGDSDICPSMMADVFFGKRKVINKIRRKGITGRTARFYFRDFGQISGLMERRGGYQSVIFDLDGTVVDGFDIIYESFNYALTTLGLSPVPLHRIRKVIGPALSEGFRMLVPGEMVDRGVRLYREYYRERYLERNRVFGGIKGLFTMLRDNGVAVGMITNKKGSFARELLDHLKLSPFFEFVLGADEGCLPKPGSELIEMLCRQRGFSKDRIIYVGDSVIDGEFSRRSGVGFIAVGMGLGKERELYRYNPLAFCSNVDELRSCLSYLTGVR